MKITGTFECYDELPEYLEIKNKEGKSFLIKLEDIDSIDNNFICNDAYFLKDVENQTDMEFFFDNCNEVIEEFEKGISFSHITISDNEDIINIVISDDENHPGRRIFNVTANWKNEANKEGAESNIKSSPERPDLSNSTLFTLNEIDKFSKEITAEEYSKVKQISLTQLSELDK